MTFVPCEVALYKVTEPTTTRENTDIGMEPDVQDRDEPASVKLGVQFWPGRPDKAAWFFTWRTSDSRQRVLALCSVHPDTHCLLGRKKSMYFVEARTYDSSDVEWKHWQDIKPDTEAKCILEYSLGMFSLTERHNFEALAGQIASHLVEHMTILSECDWARAVLLHAAGCKMFPGPYITECIRSADAQNRLRE